jgi:hypothetical protein
MLTSKRKWHNRVVKGVHDADSNNYSKFNAHWSKVTIPKEIGIPRKEFRKVKTRFPLGESVGAKRLFPLSASLIKSTIDMPTKEKVAF